MWNKSDSEKELVLLEGGSRKIRRNPTFRAEHLAPILDADMSRYIVRYSEFAPPSLRPYIKEVLVFSRSERGEINAWADIHRPHMRFVNLTPEFLAAMQLTAAAVDQLTPQIRDRLAVRLNESGGGLVPPGESLGRLETLTDSLAPEMQLSRVIECLLTSLDEAQDDPASALKNLEKFRRSYPQIGKSPLAGAGIHFALGHELGHHLLNHSRSSKQIQQQNDNYAPGAVELESWISSVGVALPRVSKRRHRTEFQADAMGVLLGSSLKNSNAVSSVRDGRSTCAGAFLSTLSLWLCNEFFAPQDQASKDHPSLHQRNLFLMELLSHTFEPLGNKIQTHPSIERRPDNHPNGYAMQIWACCRVIGDLLNSSKV